jgi:predicted GNAT family N-acyltransferase
VCDTPVVTSATRLDDIESALGEFALHLGYQVIPRTAAICEPLDIDGRIQECEDALDELVKVAAQWSEEDHPREQNGQFGEGFSDRMRGETRQSEEEAGRGDRILNADPKDLKDGELLELYDWARSGNAPADKQEQAYDELDRRGIDAVTGAHFKDPDAATPESVTARVRDENPGVDLEIHENGNTGNWQLDKVVVPEGSRGEGVGSDVMETITRAADEAGKTITLTPSTSFGATSVGRLESFYKDHGFVKNTGRNADYEISDSMYRLPGAKTAAFDEAQHPREANGQFGEGGGEQAPDVKERSPYDEGKVRQATSRIEKSFPNAKVEVDLDSVTNPEDYAKAATAVDGMSRAAVALNEDFPMVADSLGSVVIGGGNLASEGYLGVFRVSNFDAEGKPTGTQIEMDAFRTALFGSSEMMSPGNTGAHAAALLDHEFGHAIDEFTSGFGAGVKGLETARQLGDKQDDPANPAHISNYAMTNPREYFAEAFTASRIGQQGRLNAVDVQMLKDAEAYHPVQNAAAGEKRDRGSDGIREIADDFVGSIVWEATDPDAKTAGQFIQGPDGKMQGSEPGGGSKTPPERAQVAQALATAAKGKSPAQMEADRDKVLDAALASDKELVLAVRDWSGGHYESMGREADLALQGKPVDPANEWPPGEHDATPAEEERAAAVALMQAVAASPPTTEEMYRGIAAVDADRLAPLLREGGTIDLPLASFSSDQKMADNFMNTTQYDSSGNVALDQFNDVTHVMVKVEPGAAMLPVAPLTSFPEEQERVASGRFEIVDVEQQFDQWAKVPGGGPSGPGYTLVTIRQVGAFNV